MTVHVFKRPDDWPRWKRRFEQYRRASGLDEGSDGRQVSAWTGIEEANQENYDEVIVKFESFFQVRRNVILERAKFNSRNQRADEHAEVYITGLYCLVETCEYSPGMVDEMLRDRLVVGMKDKALSVQLQLDPELTLDKVKRKMRQKEAVRNRTCNCKTESRLSGDQSTPLIRLDQWMPCERQEAREEAPQDRGAARVEPQNPNSVLVAVMIHTLRVPGARYRRSVHTME